MIYQFTLAPIESILETVFIILFGVSNSYLLSLVLLAIFVRLATKPLEKYASRAVTSQAEIESVLAPQIDEIKHKHIAVQRHNAIKRLYARYAYHPVFAIRSLAGIGVQLPFFIAVYFMLSGYSKLNGIMIPVLGDLGKPDTLLFGSAHLMPFAMTLVNVLALVTVPGFNRKSVIQGLFISLMFLVLLYDSPLGLLIYWTTSNLFSLISNFAPTIGEKLKLKKSEVKFKNTLAGHSFEEYAYLFFVTNLAILVPLLGVLGEQFNFFTAHSLSSKSIIILLLVISLIPALILSFLRWASKRMEFVKVFDSAILFVFIGLFLFYILNKVGYGFFPSKYEPYILFFLALVLTIVAVVFVFKKQLLKNLSYCSLIIPMIFLNFIFASPAASLFRSFHGVIPSATAKINDTPVFLLIFDEFSGLTLQNVKGQLDVLRYPGFAELAAQSDYFPNALTAHERTGISVSSIASGNLRIRDRGLTPGDNLIEFFQSRGGSDAYSTVLKADLMSKKDVNQDSLVSDFITLYVHILSHQDWIEDKIGAIPQTWKGFGVFFKKEEHELSESRLNPHEKRFIDWIGRVDSVGVNSQLNFLHFEIPHAHYTTTSLGRPILNSKPILETLLDHDPFVPNAKLAHLNVVYHNYMQQSSYADRLLLDFIRVLKKRKLFDKSLIVVTSDHGVSYNKKGPSRRASINEGSWKNIISVPLFIKYPFQKEGNVNSSFVTTLDISSTILKVVGIESPWKSVGQSLKGIGGDFQTQSVELIPKYKKYYQNIKTLFQKARVRKTSLFNESIPVHTIAVNYTEDIVYDALLSTYISELATGDTSNLYVVFGGSLSPEEISYFGTIHEGKLSANNKIIVAVIDGKIQAVFKSGKAGDQDGFFAFSLPENKVIPLDFNISLYEIEGKAPFIFRKIKTSTLEKELGSEFSQAKQRYPYDFKKSVLAHNGLDSLRIGEMGIRLSTSHKSDPAVVFKAISKHPISEPIFHIKLESNRDQPVDLYYQTTHMPKFDESQRIRYIIDKGSNSFYIKIPEMDFSRKFRFDTENTDQFTEVIIQDIELRH